LFFKALEMVSVLAEILNLRLSSLLKWTTVLDFPVVICIKQKFSSLSVSNLGLPPRPFDLMFNFFACHATVDLGILSWLNSNRRTGIGCCKRRRWEYSHVENEYCSGSRQDFHKHKFGLRCKKVNIYTNAFLNRHLFYLWINSSGYSYTTNPARYLSYYHEFNCSLTGLCRRRFYPGADTSRSACGWLWYGHLVCYCTGPAECVSQTNPDHFYIATYPHYIWVIPVCYQYELFCQLCFFHYQKIFLQRFL